MKRTSILAGMMLTTTFFVVPLAYTQSADDIVKKVRKKYEQLQAVKIEFEQVYHWVMADETSTIRGTLYLTRDNKYRLELPDQLVVTDGKTVWTFSKKLNQVMIDRLSPDAGNPLPDQLMLRYFREFKVELVGEEKVNSAKAFVLELIPKKEEGFIRKARAWVDKERLIVLRLRQEDLNGNVTVYTIHRMVENPKLPGKLFTFEIPEGAQVVDMRQ